MDDIVIVGILQGHRELGDQFSRFARIERPVVQSRFYTVLLTVFGRVMHGFDAIQRMAEAPRDGSAPIDPIVIESAEIISREAAIARRRSAA